MNLWQRFKSWLGSFFAKPAPVQAPVQSAPAPVAPSATVTIPGTDRTIDRGVASLLGVSAQTSQILDDRAKNAPAAGNGWVDKSDLYGHSGGEESCARNTFQPGVERVVVLHPDTDSLALYWSDSNVANPSVVTCFITDAAGNVVSPAKPPEQRENTHSGRQGPVSCTPGAAYPAHITLDRGGSMDLALRDK